MHRIEKSLKHIYLNEDWNTIVPAMFFMSWFEIRTPLDQWLSSYVRFLWGTNLLLHNRHMKPLGQLCYFWWMKNNNYVWQTLLIIQLISTLLEGVVPTLAVDQCGLTLAWDFKGYDGVWFIHSRVMVMNEPSSHQH